MLRSSPLHTEQVPALGFADDDEDELEDGVNGLRGGARTLMDGVGVVVTDDDVTEVGANAGFACER